LPLSTSMTRTALLPLTVMWAEFDAPSIVTSSSMAGSVEASVMIAG